MSCLHMGTSVSLWSSTDSGFDDDDDDESEADDFDGTDVVGVYVELLAAIVSGYRTGNTGICIINYGPR